MEELIKLLQAIRPLSAKLERHLRTIIKRHQFLEGDRLLEPGQISKHILFIRSGLVRSYRKKRGRDVTKWFMREGDICISVLSFLRQKPAADTVIALESCECWGITHSELEHIYEKFPEFNYHGRIITSEYYILSELRSDAVWGETPRNKYAQLMRKDPDLVRRVQNDHLASFLNVGIRTFYSIRKEYDAKVRKIS